MVVGVYVIEQLTDAPLPPLSVHEVCGEKVPPELGLTLHKTVPVGVMWFWPLSVTVTVQVIGVPTVWALDVQVTLVLVVRTTESAYEALVLGECNGSPAYVAVSAAVPVPLGAE